MNIALSTSMNHAAKHVRQISTNLKIFFPIFSRAPGFMFFLAGPPGATNSYQVGVNHGQGGGTSYQKVSDLTKIWTENDVQVTGFDDYGNKFEFENGVSHLRGH